MVVYVIGFIGSDRMTAARRISEEYGIPLYDLAAEIKQRDGRSIRRMVITMGEHELRNKEYESLTAILEECGEAVISAPVTQSGTTKPTCSAVICCTDDIILDPMSADLIRAGKTVVVEEDPEAMFARAVALTNSDDGDSLHYAFLLDPDKARVREKFLQLYEQRKPLYDSFH